MSNENKNLLPEDLENKRFYLGLDPNTKINFLQVKLDSHYWDSVESLLNNIDYESQRVLFNYDSTQPAFIDYKQSFLDYLSYLQIGLKNTKKNGYELERVNGPQPGPETNPLLIDVNETFQKCFELIKKKNADYCGIETQDPYINIKNSITVGVSPEQGVMVRMMDKISRTYNLLNQNAEVENEAIEDTLNDLINYAAILKSYIKRK